MLGFGCDGLLFIEGSDILAEADILLQASDDVIIKEAKESVSTSTEETHAKAEVSVAVHHAVADVAMAVKGLADAVKQLKKSNRDYKKYKKSLKKYKKELASLKEELREGKAGVHADDITEYEDLIADTKSDERYYIASLAASTANVASKTTALYSATAGAAASTATYGFSGSIDLDLDGTKTESSESQTTSLASNLSGNNIQISTRVTRDEEGNALYDEYGNIQTDGSGTSTIQGSNLNANDSIEVNTGELNILASEETTNTDMESTHINAHVSIGTIPRVRR